MDNFNRDRSEIFSFDIDEHDKSTFLEMTRWTKFLAIVGFVFLGIMVVAGFFLAISLTSGLSTLNSPYGNVFGALGSMGIILLYALIAAINFYPTYALLKYSTGMKYALAHNDKARFSKALNYLKNMFKYIGILMIIMLCVYGLAIIIGIIAVAAKI